MGTNVLVIQSMATLLQILREFGVSLAPTDPRAVALLVEVIVATLRGVRTDRTVTIAYLDRKKPDMAEAYPVHEIYSAKYPAIPANM